MILSPDELREHLTTDLVDDALQRLLDAAEYLIDDRIGPVGPRTEIVGGGSRYLTLSRPIDSVVSVTETLLSSTDTLVADDYRIRGYLLERLITGTNGRFRWWGDVTVVYNPVDDLPLRIAVALDLCRLFVTSTPGLTAETIGAWSQQFASNQMWNATTEQETILSRLDPEIGMLVVGTPSVWVVGP